MLKSTLEITFYTLLICFLLAFGLPFQAGAQILAGNDTTEFKFWYSAPDARSMAMANATIADPLSNNGVYSNPGLLTFRSGSPDLSIHSTYYFRNNIFVENLASSIISRKNDKLFIGTTLIHNGSRTTAYRIKNRGLTFTQFNIDLAYARKLTQSFSIGLNVNTNYGTTDSDNSITVNSSLGILYVPTSMISYGLVFKGTGYQNDWLGSALSYYRSGAYDITYLRTTKKPQRLELGITLRFPALQKNPDFALSFSNEKLFGKSGLVYRSGLEVFLSEHLQIRGGYFHSPFSKGARMGIRIVGDLAQLDYAYSHNNLDLNGGSHLMSVTVDF